MPIDRDKFFHQFQLEISEHLSNLYRGLLHIQMNAPDKGTMKMLMTDAHTISGTSAMMGLRDISLIARSLENGYMRVLQRAGEMNAEQFNISFSALLSIATIMDEQARSSEGADEHLDAGMLSDRIREAFADICAPVVVDSVQGTDAAATASVYCGRQCPASETITVLIVDDAPVITAFGREILETAGYLVHVAADGEEALHLLDHLKFDLVVTDVSMPQMDGITLTRTIKQDGRLGNIPVVMMSTRSSLREMNLGQDAGADAYLPKNEFTVEKLLNVVYSLTHKEHGNG
jgi:CheY-like chemotaxis protein